MVIPSMTRSNQPNYYEWYECENNQIIKKFVDNNNKEHNQFVDTKTLLEKNGGELLGVYQNLIHYPKVNLQVLECYTLTNTMVNAHFLQ